MITLVLKCNFPLYILTINEVSETAILTTSQWKESEYYHIDCMENSYCSIERLHLLPLKVKQTVKQIRHVRDQVGAAASSARLKYSDGDVCILERFVKNDLLTLSFRDPV